MIWLGGDLRLLLVRAEPQSARGPWDSPADPRPRVVHGHLGALGQRLLRPHRRARLRRCVGGFLSALSRTGRGTRTCLLRPLRARGHRRSRSPRPSARSRSCTSLPRSDSARTEPGARAVPRDLPDGALPAGRLQRVALPPARPRGVLASRSAAEFGAAGLRHRPGDPHARNRGRAAAGAGGARMAQSGPRARIRRAGVRDSGRGDVSAVALAAGGRSLGVLERPGPVAPAPFARRAVRRDLGRPLAADLDTEPRATSQHDDSGDDARRPIVEGLVLFIVSRYRGGLAPFRRAIRSVRDRQPAIPLSYPSAAGRSSRCLASGS